MNGRYVLFVEVRTTRASIGRSRRCARWWYGWILTCPWMYDGRSRLVCDREVQLHPVMASYIRCCVEAADSVDSVGVHSARTASVNWRDHI